MTFVVLAVLAVVLAGPAAAVLGRVTRLRHTPRAAMVLWQATALAAVLAALGATLSLVTSYGLSRGGPFSHVVAVVALALSLLVVVRLAVAGHTVGTRLRTLRRRHRQLIDAVADPGGDGTSVVPADQAMAWCLPGVRGSRVVLTHDVAQRDNLRVGRHDGVAAVIEKLKGHPLFAHITLLRSERSPIAALVTEMLEEISPGALP